MITTLRQGLFGNWHLDICVAEDGSNAITISFGGGNDKDTVLRCERWLLRHAPSITACLTAPVTDRQAGFAWRMHMERMDNETECLPVYHDHWMEANPLVPVS